MKKLTLLSLLIIFSLLIFPACTLHIPYDWDIDASPSPYRILLKVNPDDAEVLLNGRLIGMAYEFSTPETAITLASRNNELIIKKGGFIEESINLYEYSSHRITVRVTLLKDRDYRGPVSTRKPTPPPPAKPVEKPATTDDAYKPKLEEPKTMPESTEFEEPLSEEELVEVKLVISVEEAAIYLDGRFWGLSPRDGMIENLRLKPGKYVLSVTKPGYKLYKKTLDIKNKNVNLTIKLDKE